MVLQLFSVLISIPVPVPVLAFDLDDFIVWRPVPNGPRYLLPKFLKINPHDFAEKYQKAVRESAVYGHMENAQDLHLSTAPQTFSNMPPSSGDHPNVAVILNRPKQMTSKSTYLRTVVNAFERRGPNLLSVPVGLETVLTPAQMQEVRAHLRPFDGQLGVGGDDPHPKKIFGPSADTSQTIGDISVERDEAQMAYLKDYIEYGKGRVFCMCGSMQRVAIIDGHGFRCEIADITQIAHKGPNGPVMVEVEAEPGSELATAARATRFKTSNYHHAAVDPTAPVNPEIRPISRITSYNIEGDGRRGRIPKAIEFPDGKGFATQFHPEFEGSQEESNIIDYVSQGWKMRRRALPEEISECLLKQLAGMAH